MAPGASAQTEPRHVLLLYSYEREFTHTAFAGMFRPELTRSSAEPIDYIEVALQTAGESVRAPDASIATRLGSSFAGTRLDLVVAIGGPAAAFAQAHREQLFPSTPMLFAAVDHRFIKKGTMADTDTAVAVAHDPPQMIDNILKLLPDTKTVVVVIGASQLEQFWLERGQARVQTVRRPADLRLDERLVVLGTASAMRHAACPFGDLLWRPGA